MPFEGVGDKTVEGVARGASHLFVAEVSREQTRSAGVQNHEIQPQFG